MKKLSPIFFALLGLSFAGCRMVDVKDGKVPAQYLETARAAQQTVVLKSATPSNSDLTPGQTNLTLSLIEDRFLLKSSGDLLGPGCGSSIGNLMMVQVTEGNVKWALFAFNPGHCSGYYSGGTITVSFDSASGQSRINLTTLEGGARNRIHYRHDWE